jgi:O-antigen/teichoic acid export membrane protein
VKPVDPEASDLNRGPDAVSTGRGVSYLWLQNVVSSVAKVVAFAFFARIISVNEMGVFTILNLASSAATTFMGLGMTSVVTKFVAEGITKGNRVEAASVYYEALLLTDLTSVLIAVCLLIAKFPAGVSHLPNSQVISLIGILFAADVIASFGSTPAAVLYGLLEFKAYAVIYGVYGIVRPWLVILLIYEVKSLVGLVGAWLITDTALSVTLFLYLWRRLGAPVFRFDAKYLLKLSIPLYVASVASFLYGTFDQLTLIPLVSLTALGVYGAAITAFSAYSGLISVFSSVLLPVFSGVHGINGFAGLKSSVERASRYVSIVAMPLAFGLLVTARPALTLLVGRQYEGGALPLAVLSLASTATIISVSLSPILIVLNETLLAALTSILPLLISLTVALMSIPTLGILGASVARALSMLLGLLLTWYFVRRKILVKLDFQAIMKSVAASGAMALSMEALQLLYYSRFLLPLYLIVGALVYLLAMRALRGMNRGDIDLIRQMLGSGFGGICDLLSRLVVR